MNAALENILTRASVRKYEDRPVSREDLELIVKAGHHAPTAMNRQTFQITVVTNYEMIKKLYTAIPKYMEMSAPYNFYGARSLILISDVSDKELGQMDCACVAENILLAAHSLGVGAVWINQFRNTSDGEEVRAALTEAGVPADHRVWLGVALGYPAETPAPKERVAKIVWCE